jgi:hypothetical protein
MVDADARRKPILKWATVLNCSANDHAFQIDGNLTSVPETVLGSKPHP